MIHPTAIIDETAVIADTATIGPFAVIGANVTIGANTEIGPHVVIKGTTRIGEDNRISQFASVGEDPQDLKYNGEATALEIGDRNRIREFSTINRGSAGGGGVTRIGNDNLFMAYIHIAHDCDVRNNIVFANGASLAGHVTVGDYAILAGYSGVHQFCEIGEHAFLGISSIANRDLAPYTLAVGNYADTHGINKTGLRRRGFSDATIAALHRAYKVMIRQRSSRDEAVASLEPVAKEHPEVRRFIDFIVASERGIIR